MVKALPKEACVDLVVALAMQPAFTLPLSTVHPVEMAVWGNCRGPGGRGSLCGHCCQELTVLLRTWTLTCAPQLPQAPCLLPSLAKPHPLGRGSKD